MSPTPTATNSSDKAPNVVGAMLTSISELVFPRRCPICAGTTDLVNRPWCDACAEFVCLWQRAICPVCRNYRTADRTQCPEQHDVKHLPTVLVLGGYDDAFSAVIHALKYRGTRDLASPLASCLAEFVATHMDYDQVMAVPTSKRKIQERGFGHAEEIAKCLAEEIALPYNDGLYQARRTKDQTRLSASARRENLHEAFAVTDSAQIAGKHILVVDDVMTTGATLGEAARALNAAGAKTVIGAIVALNVRGVGYDALTTQERR